MMKHLKRFVAITISMVMAFQFCTNDFYLYAETEPADPGQTQVTNEPESEPSDSTGEAAEETPSSDIGTPEPSAPVEEQPAAPVEEQPAPPVEEQPEVASTLKVEFVDANNASVKETVEQALTSKYVKDTINLDELGIDINVEGYTLTEIKDKNDNTQVYTTETKDFVLTGNVTELQFVYTQNVQTDQPEDSQEPSTPQGGQEDQNSEEDQEDTDDEDSDSQTNEDENESEDSSKDDELAYPEQILSATASDGAIITIIAKEGALPEGAEVVVEPVESDSIAQIVEDALSQEGKELQTYKAYNITILLDGEEIQPEVPIQVGITGSGVSGTEKSLFHIADGSSTAEKVSAIDTGNTQTFSADGFSIYVVTGSESQAQGRSITADKTTINVGETAELTTNNKNGRNHSWSSSDSTVVKILKDNKANGATVEGVSGGSAIITHSWQEFVYFVGWKSYSEKISITVNGDVVIRYDLNGGTGVKPEDVEVPSGTMINLPDGSGISRENYTLLGWSTTKNPNNVDTGYDAVVYKLGSEYEVTGTVTMYAVWGQSSGSQSGRMSVAVRVDGTVPPEPTLQYANYTYLVDGQDFDNILDYVNPAHTVAGVDAVKAVLTDVFYDLVEQRNATMNVYNPNTQYIEWYVVKYQDNDKTWHIDGVVRDRQSIYLNYDGNESTGGLVPDSIQVYAGTPVEVAQAGNYYNEQDPSSWRSLVKSGYDFIGWNTKADGSGNPYQPGETITVSETTTLYAQWNPKNNVTINYVATEGGSVSRTSEQLNPETGKAKGSTATAKEGYAFVNWTDAAGNVVSWNAEYVPKKVDGLNVAATYTANFEKDVYTLTINYLDDAGNSIENSYINNIRYMDPYSVSSPSISNFALIDISQSVITGNMPSNDVVVNVYYSADTHSTDPNNPDSSDGVPDKYQARIDYTVTNGAFDFVYTYVTLFDEDGNWSETGKGTLDDTQIPAATANAGYDQNSFAWQGNTPVAGYEITGNTTFNALFNAIPVTPTPTPDGGGTTTPTTPTTPGARTTDDGATTDEPEVEEVEDEETPLSDGDVEDVEDNATPKSNNSIWALINLIAAIVTVILGLFLLLSKRHRNDEEEDEEERQARMARGEEKEQEQKRGWICKVLGVIVAIVSVVFFILTEDMSLPMGLTDKWTIWMVVIAIVELVLVLVGRHWKDVDDEDQEQQA